MKRILTLFLSFILAGPGCAVTGPRVSPQEEAAARQELEEEALRTQWNYQKRLNAVSAQMMRVRVSGSNYRRAFGVYMVLQKDLPLDAQKFLKALGNPVPGTLLYVAPGSPADVAGVREGDRILGIDNRPITAFTPDEIQNLGSDPRARSFLIQKKGKSEPETVTLTPTEVLDIRFIVTPAHDINAGATRRDGKDTIIVTYGMINFALSPDELAVVVGHEMVHLLRGHLQSQTAIGVVGALLGLGIGIVGVIAGVNPGPAMQGIGQLTQVAQAGFSRDYEREADYLGLYLVHQAGFNVEQGTSVWKRFASEKPQSLAVNYLSTHPSSAERFVRVRKTIEGIKEGRSLAEAWAESSREETEADPEKESESRNRD